MRAIIAMSHDLLTDRERIMLRRMSMFVGGCSLEAAREVCGGDGIERFEVRELLDALIDKSLVEMDFGITGVRYRLLETTRQYAAEQLARSGEDTALEGRHQAWFQAFAERAEGELAGPDQGRWLDALEADVDNLRTALASAQSSGDRDEMRMAASLSHFWHVRGLLTEGGA